MNISKYLKMTDLGESISSFYVSPDEFKNYYLNLEGTELKSLIFYIIIKNTPYVFREKPLLYEQIAQWLSESLAIDRESIKMIGSAKTGFSLSPDPNYGKAFSNNSDLDFTIVSVSLFNLLNKEYNNWVEAYKERKEIFPINKKEESYWNENIDLLSRTIKRGFMDTNKIPNREICPLNKKINNLMFLVKLKLKEIHNVEVTKASVRIYRDNVCFYNQLKLNTDRVMQSLKDR